MVNKEISFKVDVPDCRKGNRLIFLYMVRSRSGGNIGLISSGYVKVT